MVSRDQTTFLGMTISVLLSIKDIIFIEIDIFLKKGLRGLDGGTRRFCTDVAFVVLGVSDAVRDCGLKLCWERIY